jgi:hypothetical protein
MQGRGIPLILTFLMVFSTTLATLDVAEGRSVHSTAMVDLFPQGDFSNTGAWSTDATTSFSLEPAEYTEAMVLDNRLTFMHERPTNIDGVLFWSQYSSSNSNYSIGAPDGASTWTTGPEIVVETFYTGAYTQYEILEVSFTSAFQITDTLQQDTVRISIQTSEGFDVIQNFAHTQGNMDYINNSAWKMNITSMFEWNWSILESAIFTWDYVSAGGVDDARLVVDAVGFEVKLRLPWYGGEVASATTTVQANDFPLLFADLSAGTYQDMTLSSCGLERSASSSTVGVWESEVLETPPEQRFGRIHFALDNESVNDVTLKYRASNDGISFTEYQVVLEKMELPLVPYVQIMLEVSESCVSKVWVDINDPTLQLTGRIFGDVDGIDSVYSRWLVFVNGEVVRNEPVEIGAFSISIPLGSYLPHDNSAFEVQIKTWFTWDSLGNESTTGFEISNMDINGAFAVEWDEDPICEDIGRIDLFEDGGGIILPFLERCSDDRHSNEDLAISFSNSNADLIDVDLAEGQIRIHLLPEVSGQAIVSVTVTDPAGNTYEDSFEVVVQSVNDAPEVEEFPGIIPVEKDVPLVVQFSASDVDSSTLTASTNKSWVTVDMDAMELTIMSPTVGFDSILFTVCDEMSCSSRTLDIEVLAMADLIVEDVEFSNTVKQGEVIEVQVYVRNIGQAEATMISVRCQTDDELVDLDTIPVLQPGQIAIASCQWVVPENKLATQFEVILDRGLNILEGNEENNEWTSLLSIEEKEQPSDNEDDSMLSILPGTSLSIATIFIILLIIFFVMFAPAKIKKIE